MDEWIECLMDAKGLGSLKILFTMPVRLLTTPQVAVRYTPGTLDSVVCQAYANTADRSNEQVSCCCAFATTIAE